MGLFGKVMLFFEEDFNVMYIMVVIGIGIVFYRGFLCWMFMEDVFMFKFGGLVWFFLGVVNFDSFLYYDEFLEFKE